MLTTLTPNPSLDRTLAVDSLVAGGVHRSASPTVEAGGKGINVSRSLIRHGLDSLALVPCDVDVDQGFLDLLSKADVTVEAIAAPGPIRSNVTVIESDGRTTKINEPGMPTSPDAVERLLAACVGAAAKSTWLAGCGSLPPMMPVDFYAVMAARVAATGVRVAVDASGPGLRHLLDAPYTVVKPNRREFEEMLDLPVDTVGDVVKAAREVVGASGNPGQTRHILVSLGADGALLVSPELVVHGQAADVEVRNTVGAGDALLAGFMAAAADAETPIDHRCLREGLAWARASLRSETTAFDPATDSDRTAVTITEVVRQGEVVDGALLQHRLVDDS